MTTDASSGGLAAGVRWNLTDLYASVDDPRIDADLDAALASAVAFAKEYRGRVGELSAADLAVAVDALEALQVPVVRAGAYSGLLFAADTSAPRHGALLQRVQERATEVNTTLLFFELEWVALDASVADPLLASPDLSRRRHFLESTRRYKPQIGKRKISHRARRHAYILAQLWLYENDGRAANFLLIYAIISGHGSYIAVR